MRIVAVKTIRNFISEFPKAEQPLLAWYDEAEKAGWGSPNDLKAHYRGASIINSKRVVFNIHGNTYRLLVDIEYQLKIVFIVWFGTHNEYDKINAETITYVKAH